MDACQFCNGAYAAADLEAHENACRFNPKNRQAKPPASSTVEAFRRFGERLEKKAHETKKLGDETFGKGSIATAIATAMLGVANEARDFADELEKEGWGQ